MPDNQRIEDLRRRVQKDPASIAFAQLAEECRRAGQVEEAVDVCRAGLAIHPGYLSARVTLGRALLELNQLDEALRELTTVLKSAPENLAAIRGIAEIHHRRGDFADALTHYRSALALARNDPDLQQTVAELARQVEPPLPPVDEGLSLEQITTEFLNFAPPPPVAEVPAAAPQIAPPPLPASADPALQVVSPPPPEPPEDPAPEVALSPLPPPQAEDVAPSPTEAPEPRAIEVGYTAAVGEAATQPAATAHTLEIEPAALDLEAATPQPAASTGDEWLTSAAAATDGAPVGIEMLQPEVDESLAEWTFAAPDTAPVAQSVTAHDLPPFASPSFDADSAARDEALRTIAALQQWLDAIHVARAHRSP